MTEQQSKEALKKIRGLYNKILDSEQEETWINALMILELDVCRKAVKELILGNDFQTYMPTIPQFMSIYKKHKPVKGDVENKELCLICMNKGVVMMDFIKEFELTNGKKQTLNYEYSLHCICDKGKTQMIDYQNKYGDRYYTEPVTKYFDVNDIKRKNMAKIEERKKLEPFSEDKKKEIKQKIRYCLKHM